MTSKVGGITPSSEVWILKVPELDPAYTNTYLFKNKHNQLEFFMQRKVELFDKYTYIRKDKAIRVDIHIDDIHNANYLMYRNKVGKWYYCFILNKNYINERVTELIITTDLLQTYMFDYELEQSYIDRCHVDRWQQSNPTTPTKEYEEEGLEFGEHIQVGTETVTNFNDTYIAICSNPLGQLMNRKITDNGQGGGDPDISCGNWENGELSSNGFRFIKGYEAYAPYKYYDKYGKVWTICYGVTTYEPDIFAKLEKMQPVPEEEGAKVSYTLKNERYGKAILDTCKAIGITKQNEFDALVSFAYNVGVPTFKRAKNLLEAIKNKKGESIVRPIWESYNTSGGVYLEGLYLRRKQECNMFYSKPYEVRPIPKLNNQGVQVGTIDGDGWLPTCEGSFMAQGNSWEYPVKNNTGTVTSLYGMRRHPISGQYKLHSGIDIGCPLNTPIYATKSGVVISAGDNGDGYGKKIRLRHSDIDMETWYCHNNSLKVKTGDNVKAGEIIALAGSTGQSTGVHLHYELRVKDYMTKETTRNPIPQAKVGDKM